MKDEIKEILDINIGNDREAYIDYIDKDGKRKNYEYIEAEDLLDYITNLQEENERLKEENKRIFSKVNDDELLISNAMNYAEAQKYKSRNEKAIKHIKEYCIDDEFYINLTNKEKNIIDVLNILQGGE